MINVYSESYLYEAYTFCAVLGKVLQDKKVIFDALGKCFMLDEKQVNEIYTLSQNSQANYINSECDFLKYNRIKQYLEVYGDANGTLENSEHSLVANVKGRAFVEAKKAGLLGVGERSQGATVSALIEGANLGIVLALKILGVLECEGIIVAKNPVAGIKKLKKASEWNDFPATLYHLYYDTANRSSVLTRLRDMTKNGINREFYEKAKQTYDVPEGRIVHEINLLEQIFNTGVAKREVCDSKYSRIISSKVLSFKDKERIVFSANKQLLSEAQCLPLKLKDRGSEINAEFLRDLPVYRESEVEVITRAIINSDLRTRDSYQPLCICCDEKYVLESTVNCFEDMACDLNVVKIEAEHLNATDFDPTSNNVFVRSCDEDRDNVFLLTLVGNVPDAVVKGIASFLQSEKRAKFHLAGIGVEIDVSLILPIVFCDKENLQNVKSYCEVINIGSVKEKEKTALINRIASEKAVIYNVDNVVIENDAVDTLTKFSVDTINLAVERAVRNNRVKRGEIHLNAEHFKDIDKLSRENKTTFGFGG